MDTAKASAAVIIPVYKTDISDEEMISLKQVSSVLKHYPIVFIAPNGLDLSIYRDIVPNCKYQYFAKKFFASINGYNSLMLSKVFYYHFLSYDYILIYQLDAFVFKDELKYWCDLGYDYIGSPWKVGENIDFIESLRKSKNPYFWLINQFRDLGFDFSGNGGFSLRNTSSFYRNSIWFNSYISSWASNEDLFWGIFVKQFNPFFKVAPRSISSNFSVEKDVIENSSIPFGCHAWEKYNRQFIEWYIQASNINLNNNNH